MRSSVSKVGISGTDSSAVITMEMIGRSHTTFQHPYYRTLSTHPINTSSAIITMEMIGRSHTCHDDVTHNLLTPSLNTLTSYKLSIYLVNHLINLLPSSPPTPSTPLLSLSCSALSCSALLVAAHHPRRGLSQFFYQATHALHDSLHRDVHYVDHVNASLAAKVNTHP